MLNERGTFESDLTAQRLSDDHYRLFVGTTAIKRDFAWLSRTAEAGGFDVHLEDSTTNYATLALMGPKAAEIVTRCGAGELNDLGYFKVGPAHLAGKHIRAARMSYVGEAGWEITCLRDNAKPIYDAMIAAGARPAGLYAQTSMRIEKGFCAMGHELGRRCFTNRGRPGLRHPKGWRLHRFRGDAGTQTARRHPPNRQPVF